jgi:hypothetical protein
MKTHEKRTEPVTREVLVSMTCDLCGRRVEGRDAWGTSISDVADTTVECKSGTNYGNDGGEITTTTFDVCPVCFVEKLMPWFRSQGAVPQVHTNDW